LRTSWTELSASMYISALDPSLERTNVEATIDVEHVARAEWNRANHQAGHGLSDIVGRAPAADRRQSFGDEAVILFADSRSHVRLDNPGTDLEDANPILGAADRP